MGCEAGYPVSQVSLAGESLQGTWELTPKVDLLVASWERASPARGEVGKAGELGDSRCDI